MKFTKEFLMEELDDEQTIEKVITGSSRWAIQYRVVFAHDGKFYETEFQRGATELQEEQPYEYDRNEIECPEVYPVKKTVTVYERLQSDTAVSIG